MIIMELKYVTWLGGPREVDLPVEGLLQLKLRHLEVILHAHRLAAGQPLVLDLVRRVRDWNRWQYDLIVYKGSSLRALVGKVWFTVILNGFEVACTDGAVQK